MKKLFLISFILTLITSCNSGLKGEGAATASQNFIVDPFEKIEIDCNCDVNLIPSTTQKIVVESHQNLVDNVEVVSKNNKLTIKDIKKVGEYDLYNVNIYITNLSDIELNAQSKLKIAGTLKTQKVSIEVNDQAQVHQAYIDLKNLKLNINDQAQVTLTGLVVDLDLNIEDEATADLSGLQAVDIKLNAKDNSHSTINPLKSMSGKASENARVFYIGDPQKDTKESDRALITKK